MQQTENIISFPAVPGTTDFLRDFIGTDAERLEAVALRLIGIESLLFFLKNSDALEQPVMSLLLALEFAVHDCLAVIDLRPVVAA